ncbi:hypothetical protein NB640_01460 [Oxalobacter vibrioformis]|uniref:Uncharacterized protein n=1 Tax=Oxalobacter vibrioformis TaxID=933080 RepID=A0A9E9LXZ4_9BURK|nr:hypothetical protein [Oxalobacter vibrioformis]WAW10361.1 hypothetical protein NB640_01460 [Oxalobacter vibrioformis]
MPMTAGRHSSADVLHESEVDDWLQGAYLKNFLMRVPFELENENVDEQFKK